MVIEGVHPRLWSYCLAYETDIFNRIWKPQHNRTGWESVTGIHRTFRNISISLFMDGSGGGTLRARGQSWVAGLV